MIPVVDCYGQIVVMCITNRSGVIEDETSC